MAYFTLDPDRNQAGEDGLAHLGVFWWLFFSYALDLYGFVCVRIFVFLTDTICYIFQTWSISDASLNSVLLLAQSVVAWQILCELWSGKLSSVRFACGHYCLKWNNVIKCGTCITFLDCGSLIMGVFCHGLFLLFSSSPYFLFCFQFIYGGYAPNDHNSRYGVFRIPHSEALLPDRAEGTGSTRCLFGNHSSYIIGVLILRDRESINALEYLSTRWRHFVL